MAHAAGGQRGRPFTGTHGEENTFRFGLLGRTGSGMSSAGNTILGQDLFAVSVSFESITKRCEMRSAEVRGSTIHVVDVPGLFEPQMTEGEMSKVILEAAAFLYPGSDAIFYIIAIGRYTEEDFSTYMRLKAMLDDNVTRYIIIIFTHGDMLRDPRDIEAALKNGPPLLKLVLQECGDRHVVFDNTATGRRSSRQVERLLDIAKALKAKNGNRPYRCPKYDFPAEMVEEDLSHRLAEAQRARWELERQDRERQQAMKRREDAMNEQMRNLSLVIAQQQAQEAEARRRAQEVQYRMEAERRELQRQGELQSASLQEVLRRRDMERMENMRRLEEEGREREDQHRRDMEEEKQQLQEEVKRRRGDDCIIS